MIRIIIAAALLAVAVPPFPHDFSGDLHCVMTERDGQRRVWTFAPNSISSDGKPVATLVETGYLGHGKYVEHVVGQRPVWIMTANQPDGVFLIPRDTPDWDIGISHNGPDGPFGPATLWRNGNAVARGSCDREGRRPTAETVPDLGAD
jgi:hypothetical protein